MAGTARRWSQPAVLTAVVGLLVLPVFLDADDLPLSTYPMYSRAREAEVDFVTAHAIDVDGTVVPLGLDAVGASDDPLIVAGELRAAIRGGRADERCEEIWQRVLADRAAAPTWTIRVVTERHDIIDHAGDRPSLRSRTVHAECGGAP